MRSPYQLRKSGPHQPHQRLRLIMLDRRAIWAIQQKSTCASAKGSVRIVAVEKLKPGLVLQACGQRHMLQRSPSKQDRYRSHQFGARAWISVRATQFIQLVPQPFA
jgi:hypothetical protein